MGRGDSAQDFPSGPVIKNLSANAGDIGSIPGPGRSHMLQSSWAFLPQLLNLGAGPASSTPEAACSN